MPRHKTTPRERRAKAFRDRIRSGARLLPGSERTKRLPARIGNLGYVLFDALAREGSSFGELPFRAKA
jgi:hypothetical protein